MIVFVDLGKQLSFDDEKDKFAFFNTINDAFVRIGDTQVFESVADLVEACDYADDQVDLVFRNRLINLTPAKFNAGKGAVVK